MHILGAKYKMSSFHTMVYLDSNKVTYSSEFSDSKLKKLHFAGLPKSAFHCAYVCVCCAAANNLIRDFPFLSSWFYSLVICVFYSVCARFIHPGSWQCFVPKLPPEDAVCLFTTHGPADVLCCCLCHRHTGNPPRPDWSCCCIHRCEQMMNPD